MSQSTEHKLVEIAQQIGNIANCNVHYTAGLASRIDASGKSIEQLTVAELIELDNLHRKHFNYQA